MTDRPKSWVYFIQDDRGDIKIGYAGNPVSRMNDMQTAHSRPLKLLGAIPGDMALEKALHKRFAALRLGGEWFRPEPELLHFIEGITYGQTLPKGVRAEEQILSKSELDGIVQYVNLTRAVESGEELAALLRSEERLDMDDLAEIVNARAAVQSAMRECPRIVDVLGRPRVEGLESALAEMLSAHVHTLAAERMNEDAGNGTPPWEYETAAAMFHHDPDDDLVFWTPTERPANEVN